ncbi:hypothetical protein TrVGV298_011202 [Trichoderma virens]|nr:hypothetical protein TrVGV298_011202 [Trichoderma virens]
MASGHVDKCCVVGTLHEGEATGKDIKIDGTIDAYLATPPADKAQEGKGILFIPDVIGIWQNSKLLADNYAAQGYTVLLPDIFNGDALKLNRSGEFDFVSWGIKALQDLGIKRIGAVGYCFGAKYVVRHYKDGIDVGFVAHPTMTDSIFPTEKRHKSEEILIKTGLPFQINLYSGVVHGFAVRCDTSVKIEKFSKEQAFFQAVTWFNEHL